MRERNERPSELVTTLVVSPPSRSHTALHTLLLSFVRCDRRGPCESAASPLLVECVRRLALVLESLETFRTFPTVHAHTHVLFACSNCALFSQRVGNCALHGVVMRCRLCIVPCARITNFSLVFGAVNVKQHVRALEATFFAHTFHSP